MDKPRLEETLKAGILGTPILHRAQRRLFLGELQERVIDAFTLNQISQKKPPRALYNALEHPQASLLLLKADLPDKLLDQLRDLSIAKGKYARLVSDPEYANALAAVVVSNGPVEPPPTTYSWQEEVEQG